VFTQLAQNRKYRQGVMNNIIIARGPAADIPHISLMLSSAAADVEV